MRGLVVVGCGGLGREVAELVRALDAAGGRVPWKLLGFLDDDPARFGRTLAGVPVLGPTAGLGDLPAETAVVLCVGSSRSPGARLSVAAALALPPDRYATLVHPAASLGASCVLGAGSIVLAGVVATADVTAGAHSVAMPAVVLTHDDELADGVTIAAGVRLAGGVRVGRGAYLGSGAVVREGVVIGAGAVVGMGAVVLGDVPAGEVWAGVPARRLSRPPAAPAPPR